MFYAKMTNGDFVPYSRWSPLTKTLSIQPVIQFTFSTPPLLIGCVALGLTLVSWSCQQTPCNGRDSESFPCSLQTQLGGLKCNIRCFINAAITVRVLSSSTDCTTPYCEKCRMLPANPDFQLGFLAESLSSQFVCAPKGILAWSISCKGVLPLLA